jgi:hypothetical protein
MIRRLGLAEKSDGDDKQEVLCAWEVWLPNKRQQVHFLYPSRSISTLNTLDIHSTGREGDVDVA